MPPTQADPAPLQQALKLARIGVLALLILAGAIMFTLEPTEEGPLPRSQTLVALLLALGSIVTRHLSGLRGIGGMLAIGAALASWAFALSVGGLGLYLALNQGARETGMLLAFGAFILAIPRPHIRALEPPTAR